MLNLWSRKPPAIQGQTGAARTAGCREESLMTVRQMHQRNPTREPSRPWLECWHASGMVEADFKIGNAVRA